MRKTCPVQSDIALAQYSSFRTGGDALYMMHITCMEDVYDMHVFAKKYNVPIFFLGGGTNILFPDEKLPALIVKSTLQGIQKEHSGASVFVKIASGEYWHKIFDFCTTHHIYGLDNFRGLPGTIGGAIVGNAGCFGKEIKDTLVSVEIWDMKKEKVISLSLCDLAMGYRTSSLKKNLHWFLLSATFCLHTDISKKQDDTYTIQKRCEKQPVGKSAGSFFKNPSSEIFAGMLIDKKAGLNGTIIGGAQISPLHGNFFLNIGGAKSADFIALRNLAIRKVKEKTGITLEPEVRIIEDIFSDLFLWGE